MSMYSMFYIENRARELIGEWLDAQDNNFDELEGSEQRRLRREQEVIIHAQVAAEVETKTTDVETILAKRVWNSPLASHIEAFFSDYELRKMLEAERDARIEAIKAEYIGQLPSPWLHIERYNKGRITFLIDRLSKFCLEICVGCKQARSLVDLVLLEGIRTYYLLDCMSPQKGLEHFIELKRLCIDCQSTLLRSYELAKTENDNVYCDIRETIERPDGVYARNGNDWLRVPDTAVRITFGDRSDYVSDQLTEQWQIPPELYSVNGSLTVQGSESFDGLKIRPHS